MSAVGNLMGRRKGGDATFTIIATSSADAASIAIPALAQAGDLAIFIDVPSRTDGAAIGFVEQPGWLNVGREEAAYGSSVVQINAWARYLTAADLGTSVVANYSTTSSGARRKLIVIARPSIGRSSPTVEFFQVTSASSNPASIVVPAGSIKRSGVAVWVARGLTVNGLQLNSTIASDVTITISGNALLSRVKLKTGAQADYTLSAPSNTSAALLAGILVR